MERAWYCERLLAVRLGVSRGSLDEFRRAELKKNGDWTKRGREIFLAETALQLLLKKLGSPDLDCSDCREKTDLADAGNGTIELAVTRVFPNPHLLECVNPSTQERVRVRVSRNENFRPRMMLKAKPDALAAGLYQLEGRTPRFPGRW